jgi:hypothetical protein
MRMPRVLLALLLAGCGGSSSETPPPLEPDPTSLRYTGPRVGAEDDAPVAAEPAPEIDEDDLPPGQKPKPAAATWGSGRTRSTPAASSLPLAPASAAPAPAAPASAGPAPAAPASAGPAPALPASAGPAHVPPVAK